MRWNQELVFFLALQWEYTTRFDGGANRGMKKDCPRHPRDGYFANESMFVGDSSDKPSVETIAARKGHGGDGHGRVLGTDVP